MYSLRTAIFPEADPPSNTQGRVLGWQVIIYPTAQPGKEMWGRFCEGSQQGLWRCEGL